MNEPTYKSPLDPDRFRQDYWKALDWERPFYLERPLAFSPAGAAQEHFAQTSIMWKFISQWIPWQYTNFHEESMSFHEAAYLGDWSSLTKFRVTGPDAERFMSAYCANSFENFDVGQFKHCIQANEVGKVVGEGMILKIANGFRYTGGGAHWLDHWFKQGDYDADACVDSPEEFVFAIQGPQSISIMEKVVGESLRDLEFARSRTVRIGRTELRLLRAGVTGELGYEVHGPSQAGNEVWSAIFEAGEEFGLKLLGGRSQVVSHVEHGFATIGRDFFPATSVGSSSQAHRIAVGGGSYPWKDVAELTRSPFELGWEQFVSVEDHEFLGSEALAREKAEGSARRWMGLEWSSDDVVDIYASMFRDGPLTTPMDLPRPMHQHAMNPDQVTVGDALVGCSTSRTYSTYLRRVISLCVIDREFAREGQQAIAVWGDRGGPQREVRVTVRELPFKPDNRRIDVSAL